MVSMISHNQRVLARVHSLVHSREGLVPPVPRLDGCLAFEIEDGR